MNTFSVTPVVPLADITEDSIIEFTFDFPSGGSYKLFVEDDVLHLMLSGNTESSTKLVSGIIVKEGEKIPPGFSVVFPLPVYTELKTLEPDWYGVALDNGALFTWKKQF